MVRSYRASKSRRDVLELRDLNGGGLLTNFGPAMLVSAVQFTGDGRRILISCADGALQSWSLQAHGLGLENTVQVGQFSRAIAISPDGRTAALGGISRLSLVDLESGRVKQRLFGHAHEITGLAFSPDGGTLASCSLDGTIKLWNLRTLQEACTIVFDTQPALGKEIGVQTVAFALDGNSLWACSRSGVLKYWLALRPDELADLDQRLHHE
jgi:WD40 repeat protein